MSDDLTREEIHDRLDHFVMDLLDAARVPEPPIDAVAIARRHLGLALELDPDADEEARHAAAAVAAGERLKPDLLRALGLDPAQKRGLLGQSLTGLFADRLLAPTAWLADEGRACGWDLFALKERFVTASHERLALRLLDLAEPCVISIIDNGHVSKRRSNAFRVNKQLSAPETRVQQYVHRYSRPHDLNEDGWRVQGWPVHVADWKREILRGVAEEY
jgi:hypothetical protein